MCRPTMSSTHLLAAAKTRPCSGSQDSTSDVMSQASDSFGGVIIGSPETVHKESILVEILFTTRVPADAADSIEEIMQIFAKAGSLGMFAGITFDPARSNIEARVSEPGASTLRYTLFVEAIEF